MFRYKLFILLLLFVFGCTEKSEPELCEINDFTLTTDDCTSDSTYSIEIDFNTKNSTADSFKLYVRGGVAIGTYAKNQLPLKINDFKQSGKDYDFLKICMLEDKEDCCKEIEWKSPDCEEDCPCEIFDFKVDVGDCTSDSTYNLWIDFEVKNPGNESFDLYKRNGKFIGNYKLNKLPLKLEDFEKSDKEYDYLKVCINDNEDCCEVIEFKPPKCECELWDLKLTAGDCTSDTTYKLKIDFKYKNVGNDYFDVFVRNNKHIGYYKFKDLPITITNFKKSGNKWDFVKICVNDNDDCCVAEEVESPDCK